MKKRERSQYFSSEQDTPTISQKATEAKKERRNSFIAFENRIKDVASSKFAAPGVFSIFAHTKRYIHTSSMCVFRSNSPTVSIDYTERKSEKERSGNG